MKQLLCLLLVSLSTRAINAQLNGTYCHYTGYESTEITFEDNRYFCYWASSCVDSKTGVGTYSIVDNNLELKFYATSPKKQKRNKLDSFNTVLNDGIINYEIGDSKDTSICLKKQGSLWGFSRFIKLEELEKIPLGDFSNFICK